MSKQGDEGSEVPSVSFFDINSELPRASSADDVFRVSLLGDFNDPSVQREFLRELYDSDRLCQLRYRVAVAVAFAACTYHSNALQDDNMYYLLRAQPVLIGCLVGLGLNVNSPTSWSNLYSKLVLFSTCLFMFSQVYLNYHSFEDYRRTFVSEGKKGNELDLLWGAYTLLQCVYLVVTLIISKVAFGFRFKDLVTLLPCAAVAQASFLLLSFSHMSIFGNKSSTWVYTIFGIHVAMGCAFVVYLLEQRSHEDLVRAKFSMKIQMNTQLDQALASRFSEGDHVKIVKEGSKKGQLAEVTDPNWSGRVKVDCAGMTKSYLHSEIVLVRRSKGAMCPADAKDWLTALDGLVVNGSVNLLLHQAFSSDKTINDNANQRIEAFISEAKEVVPLTAGEQPGDLGQEQQMHRVAAAKTGLEVALAWMKRISGNRDTANGKVFLGGSCNPTTWRRGIAMPILEEAGVPFYNPQVCSPSFVVVDFCFALFE
jgi:hypothetical protein